MKSKPAIFTFGSNEEGRHGKGAALFALQHRGAIRFQGYGLQGNSFGIPTKGSHTRMGKLFALSLVAIDKYVTRYKLFATQAPELLFELTPIGCGLAGYQYSEIGPMFRGAPDNIMIPEEFKPYV